MAQPLGELIKYPSIETPRTVLPHIVRVAQYVRREGYGRRGKTITDDTLPLPILTFRGTVKLHGQNCAIIQSRLDNGEKSTYYQSRQRILTPEDDPAGFLAYMHQHQKLFDKYFKIIFKTQNGLKGEGKEVKPEEVKSIAIFGEWCGGKLQPMIGLSQLPTMFVIFGVKLLYHTSPSRSRQEGQFEWMDMSPLHFLNDKDARIFNILQFPTCQVAIDFSDEAAKMEGLGKMEELTLKVQKECPVAKQLGAKGSQVNGEGIVWKVVALRGNSASKPNPNLKLEKFTGQGCWMKTKEVKSALSSVLSSKTQKSAENITKKQPVLRTTSAAHPTQNTQGTRAKTLEPSSNLSLKEQKPTQGTKDTKPIHSSPLPSKQQKPSLGAKGKKPPSIATSLPKQQKSGSATKDQNPAPSKTVLSSEGPLPKAAAEKKAPLSSPLPTGIPSSRISQPHVSLDMHPTNSIHKPPYLFPATFSQAPPNTQLPTAPAVRNSADTTKPTLNELISILLPKWRLEQGIQILERELSLPQIITSIGPFIEWVVKDVFKEEYDRIDASGFDRKELAGSIAVKATTWYLATLEEEWWARAAGAFGRRIPGLVLPH